MVKGGGFPRRRVVASLTLRGDTGLNVIGGRSCVVVLRVTAVAIRWRAGELAVDVASSAFQGGVRACQRISGVFQVIEFRVVPRVGAVAGLARNRKLQRAVIGLSRPREIGLVASDAGSRKAGELADRRAFVAIRAVEHGMHAEQREPVEVLL